MGLEHPSRRCAVALLVACVAVGWGTALADHEASRPDNEILVEENVMVPMSDGTRLAMGGDSAGGNLTAAALSSLGNSGRGSLVKAAILIYGAFDFAGLVAIAREAADRTAAPAQCRCLRESSST